MVGYVWIEWIPFTISFSLSHNTPSAHAEGVLCVPVWFVLFI